MSGKAMDSFQRDLAFWIQFAEIWKHLADISTSSQHVNFLGKAAVCLQRAQAIKERMGAQAAGSTLPANSMKPNSVQHDGVKRAIQVKGFALEISDHRFKI